MYKNTAILMYGKGKFINAYNDSALLITFLMEYKLNKGLRVGFPKSALGKVRTKLEKEKVSYVILDQKNNVVHHHNMNNLSRFDALIENAKKNKDDIKEVDKVIKLLEKSSDETLMKIRKEIELCLQ